MNRKLLIGIMSCIMAMGMQAETSRVMRFVPVAGAESKVELDGLRKVVFTQDSVVLIAAKDGETTPMYKYDYQAIVFEESGAEGIEEVRSETADAVRSEKFIKDGQLFIMYEGRMYDVLGRSKGVKE